MDYSIKDFSNHNRIFNEHNKNIPFNNLQSNNLTNDLSNNYPNDLPINLPNSNDLPMENSNKPTPEALKFRIKLISAILITIGLFSCFYNHNFRYFDNCFNLNVIQLAFGILLLKINDFSKPCKKVILKILYILMISFTVLKFIHINNHYPNYLYIIQFIGICICDYFLFKFLNQVSEMWELTNNVNKVKKNYSFKYFYLSVVNTLQGKKITSDAVNNVNQDINESYNNNVSTDDSSITTNSNDHVCPIHGPHDKSINREYLLFNA